MTLDYEIAEIIRTQEPAIRRAFENAIKDIRDGAKLSVLRDALRRGDIEAAVNAVQIDNAAFGELRGAILNAYGNAGIATVNSQTWIYPDGTRAIVRWNMASPRAEEYARQIGTGLITNITTEMADNVRNVIADGYAFNRKFEEIARDIVGRVGPSGNRSGGIVGLTSQQSRWLMSLRRKLEQGDYRGALDMKLLKDKRLRAVLEKAIAEKKTLSAAQIAKIAQNYERNALMLRGMTIARTEVQKAIEEAKYEAWKQGLERTGVPERFVIREWRHTGRAKFDRPWHEAMHGRTVRGLQVPFVLSTGAAMMHPHDTSMGAGPGEVINCMCQARYRLDRKGIREWRG